MHKVAEVMRKVAEVMRKVAEVMRKVAEVMRKVVEVMRKIAEVMRRIAEARLHRLSARLRSSGGNVFLKVHFSEVFLSKLHFCEMYPICVSSKLCKYIFNVCHCPASPEGKGSEKKIFLRT